MGEVLGSKAESLERDSAKTPKNHKINVFIPAVILKGNLEVAP